MFIEFEDFKMHKFFIPILITWLVFPACTKDIGPLKTSEGPTCLSAYYPLTTGSYWVYELSRFDSSSNVWYYSPVYDSLIIVGDSIIGDNTFAIMEYHNGSSTYIKLYRDSSNCLVDHEGRVFFSADNFTDTLYIWRPFPAPVTFLLMMKPGEESITVPAGTFQTLTAEYQSVNNYGTWPCTGPVVRHPWYYAYGIGLLAHYFRSPGDPSCTRDETRLVRYRIN